MSRVPGPSRSFVLITVYFLLLAKSTPKKRMADHFSRKRSRFFQGLFLSAINVFPIPYQAYMTITLANFGWFNFEKLSILTYVTGAAMGTFVMLYVYIFFFDKIKGKSFTSQKNMNYLIGAITGLVAAVTLFNILMEL